MSDINGSKKRSFTPPELTPEEREALHPKNWTVDRAQLKDIYVRMRNLRDDQSFSRHRLTKEEFEREYVRIEEDLKKLLS